MASIQQASSHDLIDTAARAENGRVQVKHRQPASELQQTPTGREIGESVLIGIDAQSVELGHQIQDAERIEVFEARRAPCGTRSARSLRGFPGSTRKSCPVIGHCFHREMEVVHTLDASGWPS